MKRETKIEVFNWVVSYTLITMVYAILIRMNGVSLWIVPAALVIYMPLDIAIYRMYGPHTVGLNMLSSVWAIGWVANDGVSSLPHYIAAGCAALALYMFTPARAVKDK